MSGFLKRLFYKRKGNVKKYKIFGLTVLKNVKKPDKKVISFLGIKIARKRKNILKAAYREVKTYKCPQSGVLDVNTIKSLIDNEKIKVVSFDIFDTLLIRPVFYPTDIFYLINNELKEKHHIDFIKYRLDAEQKLKNIYASLDDIYKFIKYEYGLSDETVRIMQKAELNCEKALLSRRQDMYEVYLYAASKNKKIVATSDMYLSSSFLKETLHKKGYNLISEVYVSNEYKARKDTGALYEKLKEKEQTTDILHIGDNFYSDCKKALECGITAIYYPSIKDIILSEHSIYRDVWNKVSSDPICRIVLGFTLNRYFGNLANIKAGSGVFADFESMISLGLAPILFYIANAIANNKNIQKNYSELLFASRDGYLPKIAYDIFTRYKESIPSKYIYAGRRAYFSSQTDSFVEYVKQLKVDSAVSYTIKNILDCYIADETVVNDVMNRLSDEDRKIDFCQQPQKIIRLIEKHADILERYFQQHRKESLNYYNSVKTDKDREIVFDCGYSGSISKSLNRLMNKPIDKVYLWETEKNKRQDAENHTTTFVLMREKQMLFPAVNLLYEELFSPAEGGCLGFEKQIPLLEKTDFSTKMKDKYQKIYNCITAYMNDICSLFSDYLPYMHIFDTQSLQQAIAFALTQSPFCEARLLKDIVFPDPVCFGRQLSLSQKMQQYQIYKNVFDMTGFDNPDNMVIVPRQIYNASFKLGIHYHSFNMDLCQEVLIYLKDFPVKFDLFITVCSEQDKEIAANLFNQRTVENLNNIIIKVVENRGRDIAPWLVDTKDLQNKYDLFCHIQSKKSDHFNFGNSWRRYLFDNLISKDAVIDILNIFAENQYLGCLFPAFYPELKNVCIQCNIQPEGMDGEINMICDLLQKMGLDEECSRNDLFFSAGSMMWYRPKALKALFDLSLTKNDFPPEPIGVGGTIAHAIERLPALVCKLSGYQAKTYNKDR